MIVELNDGAEYTVAELCRALSLNPSSYYKWKKREKSASEILNGEILAEMINIYEEHNKTYGYRRIMDEYNETPGTQYNEKRFHRLSLQDYRRSFAARSQLTNTIQKNRSQKTYWQETLLQNTQTKNGSQMSQK